jgi:hypothetical protein
MSYSRTGTNVPMLTGATTAVEAASAPSSGAPFIRVDVIDQANTSIRVEPHGAAPITATGTTGVAAYNGVVWLSRFSTTANWVGHGALLIDFQGNLPSSDPTNHERRMNWLRAYYDIVHT